jgi:hypothetical protein
MKGPSIGVKRGFESGRAHLLVVETPGWVSTISVTSPAQRVLGAANAGGVGCHTSMSDGPSRRPLALNGGRHAEAGLPLGRPMAGVNLWCRRLEVQSSELKLYVPSQCHTPSASTVTLALPWNFTNAPVPPSNVMVP